MTQWEFQKSARALDNKVPAKASVLFQGCTYAATLEATYIQMTASRIFFKCRNTKKNFALVASWLDRPCSGRDRSRAYFDLVFHPFPEPCLAVKQDWNIFKRQAFCFLHIREDECEIQDVEGSEEEHRSSNMEGVQDNRHKIKQNSIRIVLCEDCERHCPVTLRCTENLRRIYPWNHAPSHLPNECKGAHEYQHKAVRPIA